jgi:hypothetical protein
MNWEQVGAIAHVVEAFGLVPTLIFLAVELREQNKANHRASLDLLSTQWAEIVRTMNESPDFASIYLQGLQDLESLDPVARMRFGAYLLRVFRYWDGIYFHYTDGALPAQHWKSIQRQMQDVVAYPGVQAWWGSRRHWYTDEFNAFVASIIQEAPKAEAYSAYEASGAQTTAGAT